MKRKLDLKLKPNSNLKFKSKLNSRRGSVTIFQIVSVAMLVVVFGLLSSALIKNKTENNLKRAEKLVSESILNTYNDDLYKGFSLLGYKNDRELIDNITYFYEDKYNVSIIVEPTKYLSDANMIIQMKRIVLARLGISYLDDITKKLEIKDDIVSSISKGQNIVNNMETKLEAYDEFLELTTSLANVFVDIKNGYELESLDDKYGLSSLNYKLSRVIKLDDLLNSIGNKNGSDSSLDESNLMDNIKRLKSVISSAKSGVKDTSELNNTLLDIAEEIIIETNYELDNGGVRSSKDKGDYWEIYETFKNIHKNKSKDISEDIRFDVNSVDASNLFLNPLDKMAFIEYMTIMLSDEVESGRRDHYYTNRSGLSRYESSELEYIITGFESNTSKSKVKNFIRTIRFPLNLLHIYSEAEKLKIINELAIAIAALIPVPPFVSSPIMAASWAYLETEWDIKMIYKGDAVVFIKGGSDDWATDFGFLEEKVRSGSTDINKDLDRKNGKSIDITKKYGQKKAPKKDESILDTSELQKLYYNDYLRLMALTKSSSDMMERFKTIVYKYIDDKEFNINNLVIEHKVDIYIDKKHNYKFKESLIDGYIN